MPDPANDTGIPASTPPPDSTAGPNLTGLRAKPVQPASESTFQTVKRNLTPELDTSNAAKGPGHEFENDSPQSEGEQQYREKFGSPLERFYGSAKKLISEHEQHLSEKYLAPFRRGLDSMASDLVQAGETGHTKSGGQLTPTTRALVGAAGAGLRAVPIGSNVKETAAALVVPPEFPEGRGLSAELKASEKAAEKAAPNLEGLRVRKIKPTELPASQFPNYTKDQMIAEGADGHLNTAVKAHIPLDVIEGHEPIPAMEGGYKKGTPITQPIEVSRNPESGKFTLYAGNHRVQQAKVNGQTSIPAFVEGATAQDLKNFSAVPVKTSTKAPDLEGIRSREVSPATAVESSAKKAAPQSEEPTDEEIVKHFESRYPVAKGTVDGRAVRENVPNLSSIGASLNKYKVLGGVREVPISEFPAAPEINARTKQLAEDIKNSGEINPLIVAVDHEGPYILEGGHRYDALKINGAKSFPAVVVTDLEEGTRAKIPTGAGSQTEQEITVYHGKRDMPASERLGKDKHFYVSKTPEFASVYGPVHELKVKPSELLPDRAIGGGGSGTPKTGTESLEIGSAVLPSKYYNELKPHLYTPAGAQGLADKLGAKVVGSVAKAPKSGKFPGDLDLRIEGAYKADEVTSKMKEAGFEPRGSTAVSPKEAEASGKPYGKPGWKRAEHFENSAGEKIDVWHDEPEKSWEIHDLGKEHNIPSDEGYLYHATNHDRARDIAESGLDIHKPSYGTDQEAWPDGSRDKRSYFTQKADHAWQFSPEEGKPALLRMKQDPAIHSRESTGDFYSKKKIPANKLEVLGDDKQWHPVSELSESKTGSQTEKLSRTERWTRDKGSIPGEPLEYLDIPADGDYNKAKAIIVERETPKGSRFEASTGDYEHIGIFKTLEEAHASAEKYFGSSKTVAVPKAEPKIPLHEKLPRRLRREQPRTPAEKVRQARKLLTERPAKNLRGSNGLQLIPEAEPNGQS